MRLNEVLRLMMSIDPEIIRNILGLITGGYPQQSDVISYTHGIADDIFNSSTHVISSDSFNHHIIYPAYSGKYLSSNKLSI